MDRTLYIHIPIYIYYIYLYTIYIYHIYKCTIVCVKFIKNIYLKTAVNTKKWPKRLTEKMGITVDRRPYMVDRSSSAFLIVFFFLFFSLCNQFSVSFCIKIASICTKDLIYIQLFICTIWKNENKCKTYIHTYYIQNTI